MAQKVKKKKKLPRKKNFLEGKRTLNLSVNSSADKTERYLLPLVEGEER